MVDFPDVLPAEVRQPICDALNPCPHRPRRFLGRFTDRPYRCPQCGRWWVTRLLRQYDDWIYQWVRAEPPKGVA